MSPPIALSAHQLRKHFPIRKFLQPARVVKALDGVSFSLPVGKTLAVVGESGCGKSTLAKVLLGIESPTDGSFQVGGRPVAELTPTEFRRSVQMIFQDPYSSLNPRRKAWQIIAEPLVINGRVSSAEARERALAVMAQVGLRPEFAGRYPHMFSGGQRQRLGIARALILKPKVLLCDEPISALDVSIQAQVINLLLELQDQQALSYVFISHDLSVVRHIADDVLIMYLGKAVEHGPREAVFAQPLHPYSRALLGATPKLRGKAGGGSLKPAVLQGEPPSPLNPPSGCTFHKRCPHAIERCKVDVPALRELRGRLVACHLAEQIADAN